MALLKNKYLISFLLGLIGCLALAPYNFSLLILPSLAGLYWLLSPLNNKDQRKTAFLIGVMYALGYFVLGLYWIGNAVIVHWEDYWWAYPFAVFGIPIVLSLFWGASSLLTIVLSRKNSLSRAFLFIALLSMFEWIRGWIFTGFPWNLPGYAWNGILEIAQLSAVGGIYFLTLFTVLVSTLMAHGLRNKQIPYFFVALFLVILCYGLGSLRLYAYNGGPLGERVYNKQDAVLIVQPNIPQKDKWVPSLVPNHLSKLIELSTYTPDQHTELPEQGLQIVWPETAMSSPYFEHPYYRKKITEALQSWPVETSLITGVLHREPIEGQEADNAHYYNAIYNIDQNGDVIGRYNKRHLVPFGEYIPFIPEDILMPMNVASFTAGKAENSSFVDSSKMFPLICYEVIFPRQMMGADVSESMKTAKALVTITNDAWYADAPGPYQHHAMARFRAIEQGLPLYRSANTGISGAYDSVGQDLGQRIGYGIRKTEMLFSPISLNKQTLFSKYGNLIFFSTLSIFYFLFMVLKKKPY